MCVCVGMMVAMMMKTKIKKFKKWLKWTIYEYIISKTVSLPKTLMPIILIQKKHTIKYYKLCISDKYDNGSE